jgi:small multidrug resistance family-3 protein
MNLLIDAKTLLVFFLSGLLEIGGGYLVWIWLNEGRPAWVGGVGGVLLAVYGLVIAQQSEGFGYMPHTGAYSW